MLPLPELQRRFSHALHDPQLPVQAVRAGKLDAARRLQVYRNNMQTALTSALAAVYPVTLKLVGEEFFEAAARGYVKANPSHSGNIQDYGGAFPLFLNSYGRASSLPYLGDVAALEWHRQQTAVAPPHRKLDTEALARVPVEMQPELRFHHQPAACAFDSRFPVLSIWEFCSQSDPEGSLDISLPGECVLFARPALDVVMRRLSPGEYRFLQGLCRGGSFGEACAAALEAEPGFDVPGRFAALVQDEILTDFYL